LSSYEHVGTLNILILLGVPTKISIPLSLYRHLFEHISDKLTLLTLQKGIFFLYSLTVYDTALLNY
jgi:hypothetical protein